MRTGPVAELSGPFRPSRAKRAAKQPSTRWSQASPAALRTRPAR